MQNRAYLRQVKTLDTTERRMLVVLAHPDDESFPIGGTLARYAAEGVHITLVCATRGQAGIPGLTTAAAARIRTQELQDAATILRLAAVQFLDYEDGALAAVDVQLLSARIRDTLHRVQPQVVITFGPDGISGHPDHLAVHRATTAAFDLERLPALLYYIAPSEATWQGCGITPTTLTTGGVVAAIDVEKQLVAKVRAMQAHASQKPPFSGPASEEAKQLVCHEYFTMAHSNGLAGADLTDLFQPLALTVNRQ